MPAKPTCGAMRCRSRSWMPAPRSTPCISASDSPSASTIGCCWWSCAWCCRLSRCACSLASAGNVCWAKPNHGFFHCQQPVAIFFRARRRHVHGDARTHDRHASIASPCTCIVVDASMRCTQAMARLAAHARATSTAIATTSMHGCKASARACANAFRSNQGCNPRPPISRRTSGFARKLRGIFSRCARDGGASTHVAGAENEEPATSPPRVPGRAMSARISGLRLPAIRRRHPDRAGR